MKCLSLYEKDAPAGDPNNVDAVTGATLTSDGVEMCIRDRAPSECAAA